MAEEGERKKYQKAHHREEVGDVVCWGYSPECDIRTTADRPRRPISKDFETEKHRMDRSVWEGSRFFARQGSLHLAGGGFGKKAENRHMIESARWTLMGASWRVDLRQPPPSALAAGRARTPAAPGLGRASSTPML
mmetsp:Transcript_32012/g.91899  ORF Transcript_32012/g.91899 Transcript_32012/m.91899 type:complete len:136 (-) Transcript_32012:83-490(-)